MVFRAGGLVSGLDTNSIIEGFVKLERMPIDQLESRKKTLGQQKAVLSDIASALNSLSTQMGKLDTANKVLSNQATSSNAEVMTVSATGEAVQGTHIIQTLQLARAEQDRSTAFAAGTTAVRTGKLTLTVQGKDPVEVEIKPGNSLDSVAYRINISGARVSATVINTGTESYLSVFSMESGYDGADPEAALAIQEDYTGTEGQVLGLTTTVQAQNAKLVFDGLAMERKSNSIKDITKGLVINLIDDKDDPTINITVAPNKEAVKTTLLGFADSYNKAIKMLSAQFQYTEGQTAGVLFGDGTLRNLLVGLQTNATGNIDNDGVYSTLAAIGMKTEKDGTLSVDDTKLTEAMDKDFQSIADLFVQNGDGLADKLTTFIKQYTNTANGILKYRDRGIDQRNDALDDQIARMEDAVAAYEERLVKGFTAMENTIAQLQDQQGYLSAMTS